MGAFLSLIFVQKETRIAGICKFCGAGGGQGDLSPWMASASKPMALDATPCGGQASDIQIRDRQNCWFALLRLSTQQE